MRKHKGANLLAAIEKLQRSEPDRRRDVPRHRAGEPQNLKTSKRHAQLADHLALEDVAEHVRLDVLVEQVDHLDRRRQLVAQELHAEGAVDLRVGLGRAGEARIEHVLAERVVHDS